MTAGVCVCLGVCSCVCVCVCESWSQGWPRKALRLAMRTTHVGISDGYCEKGRWTMDDVKNITSVVVELRSGPCIIASVV